MSDYHDSKALEFAREVMALMNAPMPIGGEIQLQAKVQCLFVEAMQEAGKEAEGWQLVPKEPTIEMNGAGWVAMNEDDAINPTYRAMLAAAPKFGGV